MTDIRLEIKLENNKGDTEWLEIPTNSSIVDRVFNNISKDGNEEVLIKEVDQEEDFIKHLDRLNYETIFKLNNFITELNPEREDKVLAMIDGYGADVDLIYIMDNYRYSIDNFIIHEDITIPEDYGRYCLDEFDLSPETIIYHTDLLGLGEFLLDTYDYEEVDLDPVELAEEYIESHDLDDTIKSFINLDDLGNELATNGVFTSYGYLEG